MSSLKDWALATLAISLAVWVGMGLVDLERERDREREACKQRGGHLVVSRDGRWCVSKDAFR